MMARPSRFPLIDRRADRIGKGSDRDDRPGGEPEQHDGDVVPEGVIVLEAIGGKALEIVLEEEDFDKGGVPALDGDKPGEDHREIKHDARPPEAAAKKGPFAAQDGEDPDDDKSQQGRDRTFGKGGSANEEVNVEEPEFAARLIPGVPTEHADTERGGQLHVRGGATGKAEDARAGSGDERGVELAAIAKATDMQVDEHDQHEGKAGRGKACGPVMDAELAEGEHGAPVVKGRLFKPGMPPEHGRDVIVAGEHFASDLSVTRLVGTDEAEAIATKDGHQSVEEKEGREPEEGHGLRNFAQGRKSPPGACEDAGLTRGRSRWISGLLFVVQGMSRSLGHVCGANSQIPKCWLDIGDAPEEPACAQEFARSV